MSTATQQVIDANVVFYNGLASVFASNVFSLMPTTSSSSTCSLGASSLTTVQLQQALVDAISSVPVAAVADATNVKSALLNVANSRFNVLSDSDCTNNLSLTSSSCTVLSKIYAGCVISNLATLMGFNWNYATTTPPAAVTSGSSSSLMLAASCVAAFVALGFVVYRMMAAKVQDTYSNDQAYTSVE